MLYTGLDNFLGVEAATFVTLVRIDALMQFKIGGEDSFEVDRVGLSCKKRNE